MKGHRTDKRRCYTDTMNGKRMIRAVPAVLAVMAAAACRTLPEQPEIREEPVPGEETAGFITGGNLLKIEAVQGPEYGEAAGLIIDPSIGDGAFVLAEGVTEGSYESAVYECTPFTQMVTCWNAAVYEGGEIEVFARVRTDGEWTDYLTWGPYTPYDFRGTKEGKTDTAAYIDHDVFCLRDERTADAVQMKVIIRRNSTQDASPAVRRLTMTFRGGSAVPVYAEEPVADIPVRAFTEAPAVSQLVRSPRIARAVCSPTVVSVMLNSRVPGLDVLPEELALNTRDEGEGIFGNWSFDMAGAGLYGFEAYPQYCGPDILLQELAKGHPTGISVSYTNERDAALPYLEGVYGATNGHIICLTGYEYEDGIRDEDHLYFHCTDPFAEDDMHSRRRYAWRQLKECYRGLAYIIPDSQPEVTGEYAPGIRRIEAELVPDGERRNTWHLYADGSPADMERFLNGSGILMYRAADAQTYSYDIMLNADGTLVLDKAEMSAHTGQDIIVLAVSDRGVCYSAVLPAE